MVKKLKKATESEKEETKGSKSKHGGKLGNQRMTKSSILLSESWTRKNSQN